MIRKLVFAELCIFLLANKFLTADTSFLYTISCFCLKVYLHITIIALPLDLMDINNIVDISSATYRAILNSAYQAILKLLFLQGELDVVKDFHREDDDELGGASGSEDQ